MIEGGDSYCMADSFGLRCLSVLPLACWVLSLGMGMLL